jgi:preprotein translocase subunit SecA
MMNFIEKIFGSKRDKDVEGLLPVVDEINEHWEKLASLSDDELRGKTDEFRQRINDAIGDIVQEREEMQNLLKEDIEHQERMNAMDRIIELDKERGELTKDLLDELLPEAFAVVKEGCKRLVGTTWNIAGQQVMWDMVPFDVQLIGGAVLHKGKIAEMATGEGKTLVATLPVYLNALPGRGVHIVTVNDYLALRDSQWMGKLYEFLGLKVGVILQSMQPYERKVQYAADVTYGTNNEFGFDYLRDNMVTQSEEMVQRPHNFAIVDEVDSVLVDEARTPLIISGPVESNDHKFDEMRPRVEALVNAQKSVVAKFVAAAEELLKSDDSKKKHEAGEQLVRANHGMPKNKRYLKLVADGETLKLMQQTELEYMRDSSRNMHILDDELYFIVEEKNHNIDLTDKGRDFLAAGESDPGLFVLPDIATELSQLEHLTAEEQQSKKDEINLLYADRSDRLHTISQLLRAFSIYEKDVDYVVQEGKVLIVDEFTGRILPGRRYSEGLHQAIEAKEQVHVERDTQTMATITLQNYFRLYKKLAGMTGTAETEAGEFFEIYKLDVVVIPTNKPIVREDRDDMVYRTKREKYNAVVEEIAAMRTAGRPVLVGTTSVEVSETIGRMLKRAGVPHNVLNAKQHAREAEIIINAGLPGAITIATNMAGRGTDIKLGPGVRESGGLHILGTERHDARRIDRQLRGRAGRQGDPGSTQFYLSLEDDLMRLFGSERIAGIMQKLGLQEGEVIKHSMITKSVERAQKKVEENNFAMRKRLLEYDNVMNSQREVVYDRRRHALYGERLKDEVYEMLEEAVTEITHAHYHQGELEELRTEILTRFMADVQMTRDEFAQLGEEGVTAKMIEEAKAFYTRKEDQLGHDTMAGLERYATLRVIDEKWKEHLREMDELKEGIGLRAYGQKDPLIEYKQEGYRMFQEMLALIRDGILELAFKLYPMQVSNDGGSQPANTGRRMIPAQPAKRQRLVATKESVPSALSGGGSEEPEIAPAIQPVRVGPKVGRNDPCPCGSGKKYKNCHGAE